MIWKKIIFNFPHFTLENSFRSFPYAFNYRYPVPQEQIKINKIQLN